MSLITFPSGLLRSGGRLSGAELSAESCLGMIHQTDLKKDAQRTPSQRAWLNGVHAHHDVAHCSRVIAMQSIVRAAVKSSKLAVNRSTAAVVTRHERCAVSNDGCRIGSVGDYDIGR